MSLTVISSCNIEKYQPTLDVCDDDCCLSTHYAFLWYTTPIAYLSFSRDPVVVKSRKNGVRCRVLATRIDNPATFGRTGSESHTQARTCANNTPTCTVAFSIDTSSDTCAAVLLLYPHIVCCSPTAVLKDRNEIGVQSVRARLCLADLQAPWTVPLIEMAASISIDQYQHDFAINLDLDPEPH
jgi:hypothetical protein